MKLLMIILFWTGNWQVGETQQAKEDFKQINEAYQKNDKLQLKMTYEVFRNWESETPLQKEQSLVKKDGPNMYTRIGNMEAINRPDYNLVVDHDEKMIAVMKVGTNLPEQDNELLMMNLEKALGYCEKVDFAEEDGQLNSYTLTFPDGVSEYKKVKFIYDKKSFFIRKMVLFYGKAQDLEGDVDDGDKEKPRMEVNYDEINTRPVFQSATFSYDMHLTKKNGKLQCKPQYNTYTLIDHLTE